MSTFAVLPQAVQAVDAPSVEFLVVGDWGRNGASHQRDVALQMGKSADRLHGRFVISVGDNFYEDGVQSVTDAQWRTSYEEVYAAPALQIPWIVALGNHDYRGVPQAQIEYARISPRWKMPSRYYKVNGSDLGAPHLDLFVIDTSPLVHQYRQNVHEAIAANVAGQDVPAQLQWLDQALARSAAPWKVVVGHHTIYSGGTAHGDTVEVRDLIVPLLHKYGVQLYINGHDHDLQHIRRGGVDYLCCGAGSEVRPVRTVEGTLFCAQSSGFACLHSQPDTLGLELIDSAGAALYHSSVPRRKNGIEKAA